MGPTLTEATPCADHRAMTEAAPLPLARFTIVEVNDEKVPLCLRLATSLAAKIAADLGADVLKIEPPGGDPVRSAPPFLPQGGSALFQFLNTSKRSLVLDLKTDAGRAGLARLLDKADACLFEEPASIAPLVRAGRATPIEIAAFAARNGGRGAAGERAGDPGAGWTDAHGGRARAQAAEARRPPGLLCRGPHRLHRPRRRAGRTRRRPAGASRARVAGRSDAMGELEGGLGRGGERHLAGPRGQETRNSRSCPAATATSPWSTP